jgi:cephalosporin-C deacetylase
VAALVCLATLSLPGRAQSQARPVDCTILPVPPATAAQLIRVTLDRDDWTYGLGETPRFHVRIALDPYPEAGVNVSYRMGPDMLEGEPKTALVPAEGLTLAGTVAAQPGFLRCMVSATIAGKSQRGIATAAIAPGQIQPTQTDPDDFDPFWAEQKAILAKVPIDAKLTPAPELSTSRVEVSYLSLQNVGGWAGNSRFHGVLAVPRGTGPFPAVLAVPGAGVRPYHGLVELAGQGLITLQVGIHGIPVNLPEEVYAELAEGALADYSRFNLDDRGHYYYRRVYLGCLRANDFLVSFPKWDRKHLIVMGGSQGGQLTLATAALDSRVTGLAASFPAFCDVTGYLHGRAGGWPGLFRSGRTAAEPRFSADNPEVITTRYYDSVNFARRIKVPGHYSWGYNDQTCPPTSTFCAYNVITAPKELVIAPPQGHAASPAQTERINAWVLAHAGLTPSRP